MANNIIDSIRLSGTTYQIQGSGGTQTIELTQAQYDALVDKDPNVFYIITDAEAGDLTNYYTKSETNTLLGDKADTATTYTKTEVDTALATKQATLQSGTNIKTINNESILGSGNIDIQGGGGGGKAISGGTNISITTGETADTVSCTLPISADSDGSFAKFVVGSNNTIGSYTNKNIVIGDSNTTLGQGSGRHYTGATIIGYNNTVGCIGIQNDNNDWSTAIGRRNKINGGNSYVIGVDNNFFDNTGKKNNYCYVFGRSNTGNATSDVSNVFVFGAYNKITKTNEFALGEYNNSVSDGTSSGNTFFSIGNGTSSARHNAFEIKRNGDIYITLDGQDVKLQDQLGGSSITVDTALDSGSTNAVANSAITTAISTVSAATSSNTTALGGLSLVKLTQSEYDALSPNYDSSTLYIIT